MLIELNLRNENASETDNLKTGPKPKWKRAENK